MWRLIWAALLLSPTDRTTCQAYPNGWTITDSPAEITTETGLCAVIPCSFTHPGSFTPKHVVWYKCPDATNSCYGNGGIIFHSGDISSVQEGFRERVALLDTDLTRNNCSVIISDIRDTDSGYYMLRLKLTKNADGTDDGLNFADNKRNIVVRALSQRPSVSAPPLIGGQRATLTCWAPGSCSGTPPLITWTWRGTGDSVTGIPHNTTIKQTRDNLTSITPRHLSTLAFNPSAEHHGANVTCQVTFKGNVTTEDTVTLNVTYAPVILPGSGCLVLSEVLTCVCFSRGRPPPLISWLNMEEHSFTTMALGTIVSTTTPTARYQLNTTVECVSRNALGNATEELQVAQKPGQNHKDREGGPMTTMSHLDLKTIVAFVIGVIVSATLCCFTWKCHRCQQKVPDTRADALDMVACGDQKGVEKEEGEALVREEEAEIEHEEVVEDTPLYSNIMELMGGDRCN